MNKRRLLALSLALALSFASLAPVAQAAEEVQQETPSENKNQAVEEEKPADQKTETEQPEEEKADEEKAEEEKTEDQKEEVKPVQRLAGSNRIQTAIEVSKEAYPEKASALVLTGYSASADALAGTLYASLKEAPILVVGQAGLTAEVQAEIKRLGPSKVYILGGTASLPSSVDQALRDEKITVERVQGQNRYATAVEIAKTVADKSHVFLALGNAGEDTQGRAKSLADALTIGPASAKLQAPILLTAKDKLPEETLQALSSFGVKKVTIVGGEGSVSKEVEKELIDLGIEAKNIDRLAGKNRYETATAIAGRYFKDSKKALLANGALDVDALVGGVLAAKEEAPILLSDQKVLAPATKSYLKDHLASLKILGGPASISKELEKEVQALLTSSVEAASQAVEKAEKSKDLEDLAQAEKMVQALEKGEEKEALVKRLASLKKLMKEELDKKAKEAVEKAEKSKQAEDLEAAQTAVQALEDGETKTGLEKKLKDLEAKIRLQAIIAEAQAVTAEDFKLREEGREEEKILTAEEVKKAERVLAAQTAFDQLSDEEKLASGVKLYALQELAKQAEENIKSHKPAAVDWVKNLLAQKDREMNQELAQEIIEASRAFDVLSNPEKIAAAYDTKSPLDIPAFDQLVLQAKKFLQDQANPQG